MKTVKDLSAYDLDLISTIAKMAHDVYAACGVKTQVTMIMMDLTCVHLNACPMRLEAMADPEARKQDVMHDVVGIHANLNRETGLLENCFTPRFARLDC